MAKRFTDTEKWNDPWFDNLSNDLKLFWLYLCDSCDHAGIWKINKKLAEYHIGQISWEEVDNQFNGRVIKMNNEKWFVPKFILFQYPHGLSKKLDAHKSVIRLLNKHKMKDHISFRGQRGLKQGSKRGDSPLKVMDMVKVKDSLSLKAFGKYVRLSDNDYIILCERFDKPIVDKCIEKINDWISSKGKRQYKDYAAAIRNWLRKEDVPEKNIQKKMTEEEYRKGGLKIDAHGNVT